MKITHWMRRENSGLVRATLEVAEWERRAGHEVSVREPSTGNYLYGSNGIPDIHCIHSQISEKVIHDGKPKIMWMHGEPLGSVANLMSMRAIVDLASACDAFVCMRKDEWAIWNSIKRTHLVKKGVDLERFSPREVETKLSGSPSVLYCENWREYRNPLYLCVAMQYVAQKFPEARLHLYNCTHPKMLDTFLQLTRHNHWASFLRSIQGPAEDVVELYNRADIVVSCLYPLYARTPVEGLACGKPIVCPGYNEPGYPWTCTLDPLDMARAIVKCWEGRENFDARAWAQEHHDIKDSVAQAITVYEKYL